MVVELMAVEFGHGARPAIFLEIGLRRHRDELQRAEPRRDPARIGRFEELDLDVVRRAAVEGDVGLGMDAHRDVRMGAAEGGEEGGQPIGREAFGDEDADLAREPAVGGTDALCGAVDRFLGRTQQADDPDRFGEGLEPAGVRSNRRTPNCFSNASICRLIVAWPSERSCAALAKLPIAPPRGRCGSPPSRCPRGAGYPYSDRCFQNWRVLTLAPPVHD